jgi:hypothetical protein
LHNDVGFEGEEDVSGGVEEVSTIWRRPLHKRVAGKETENRKKI